MYGNQYQGQGQKNPPGVPANYVPPPTLAPGQPMVMQQQQQQQPQVVVVHQPHFFHRPPVYEGLALGQLRTSGILQIIIGVFAFLINIMAKVTIAWYSDVGIGFWGGIIFIVSGSMAIAASSRATQPMVSASAAFAIIAGVLACIMIALSAAGIKEDVKYGVSYYSYLYIDPEGWYNAAIAANSILLILGGVELCMTLWQAVICFNALCNMTPVAPPPLPGVQLVAQPQQQQQQQQQSVIITGPSTSAYPPVPYNAAAAQPPPYNSNYDNKY